MLRNVLLAVLIFALITGIAVWVATLPEKATVAQLTPMTPAPAVAIALEPSGSFIPRTMTPNFTVRAHDLKSVVIRFYHIQNRELMLRLYRGITQGSLSPVAAARLLSETSHPTFSEQVELKDGIQEIHWANQYSGGTPSPPGLYFVTAAALANSDAQAVTWFVRSNLHVILLRDPDGWHSWCQSSDADAARVRLTWYGFDATPLVANASCSSPTKIPPAVNIPAHAPLQLVFGEDVAGNLAFVPMHSTQLPSQKKGRVGSAIQGTRSPLSRKSRSHIWW